MPLTPEHNIYYPDSQSQFTPLESHFAAMATSVDDAMIAQDDDFDQRVSDLQSILEAAIRNAVPAGTITAFGGTSAPDGYLLCDGAVVSTTAYPELFAAIGFSYGQSGSNFRVPDLRGRVPVGLHSGQSEFNELGKTGGARTHTLTVAQMPSHNHGGRTGNSQVNRRVSGTQGTGSPVGSEATFHGADTYRATMSDAYTNHGHDIPSQGSGQAHNNLQPYNTVNYIIKT